jgi:hypothetical protein
LAADRLKTQPIRLLNSLFFFDFYLLNENEISMSRNKNLK